MSQIFRWSALHYAAFFGDEGRCRELLAASPGDGASSVWQQGFCTPLHAAATACRNGAVALLVAARPEAAGWPDEEGRRA